MRITEIGHKRYLGSPAGAALLSRCFAKQDKYGGNNVLGNKTRVATGAFARLTWAKPGAPEHKPRYKNSTNESATSAPWLLAMRVAARSTFFISPSR
jgi:hypothetical protein